MDVVIAAPMAKQEKINAKSRPLTKEKASSASIAPAAKMTATAQTN